jgi:hypothetical protein
MPLLREIPQAQEVQEVEQVPEVSQIFLKTYLEILLEVEQDKRKGAQTLDMI